VLGAAVTFAALLVPGVRQMDEAVAAAPAASGGAVDGALRATA
jgi:hypothetical protein